MKMRTEQRAIDKIYKRRDRIEMPDYQRDQVWALDKKRLLIDTILSGWSLPKFYFEKIDESTFECVDGQQRLVAIIEFFEDKLILDSDTAQKFGGDRYTTIPPKLSDKYDDFIIDVEEIEDATDEELEELFKRLQLGTPLITAEKLNAVRGQMRNFCQSITAKPFFTDKIRLKNTRFSHYEIAVRWMYIESKGIEPRVRLAELEQFVRDNKKFNTSSPVAKLITATLEYLDKAFPVPTLAIRNKSNTLSVCMLASRIKRTLEDDSTAKVFGLFVEEFFSKLALEVERGVKGTDSELREYQQAITSASAEAISIKTRLRILTKRLAIYSPEFSFLIGSYSDVGDSVNKGLLEKAESIRELVEKLNDKNSANNGEDLFKMTNKTTPALMNLKKPRTTQEHFEDFIDELYFLFYEGSGSGNRLPEPKSDFVVTDIKFLRANTRHDLDRGKPSESAGNRKKKAAVFKKYSGKDSIGLCGEEELLATQSRILEEAEIFLAALLK